MISRIYVRMRWLRRLLSRNVWSAKMLGYRAPKNDHGEPGLILIQIDGLSRKQFEKAVQAGRLPFLRRLLRREHFNLETFYSGVPSTTPAVQGEIFFGVKQAVPAFHFLRRKVGRDYRMYEVDSSIDIEDELLQKCESPLLEGGRAYSNIYRAGAETRYCSRDFAVKEIWGRMRILKWIVLCVIYLPKLVRMATLALIEIGLSILDAVKGLYDRQDIFKEVMFVPARVAVCVVLREMIRFRVLLDIERGVRVIHANFLGYDEQAHRRGPDSAFAHWSLKAIDSAIRDIYKTANTSSYRDYEIMVYSDHGQEKSTPFVKRTGKELEVAIADALEGTRFGTHPVWMRKMPVMLGVTVNRWRSLFGLPQKQRVSDTTPDPTRDVIVTAMGPVGHIYLPEKANTEELESIAQGLVQKAVIPLVLLPGNEGEAIAFNERGRWILPDQRSEVLGETHPFLDEAADDLVKLCFHQDAGDIILSGWDPQKPPLTFPLENGAHGGPGSEETRGFLLLPDRIRQWHVSHLANTKNRVRGEDLRKIALHYLGKDGVREERVTLEDSGIERKTIRVMTYNIHSCIGLDGRVRPERVARVINQYDPDIIAVQEVDCHRLRTSSHDQSKVIAEHLRMHHVFHALFEEQMERYGIAIFSKHPVEVVKADYLTLAMPERLREARGAIWVKVRISGMRDFHFVNTHFGLGGQERMTQAKEIMGPGWLGNIPDEDPVILCGDLNSGPGSKVLKLFHYRLRDVQHMVPGFKPKCSFTSIRPFRRIDHIFVSSYFKVESVTIPNTSTAVMASDHLPVCTELSLPVE